jgi:hypothetical protein
MDAVLLNFDADRRLVNALRAVLQYCNKMSAKCMNVSVNGSMVIALGVRMPFNELMKLFTFELLVYDDENELHAVPIGISIIIYN